MMRNVLVVDDDVQLCRLIQNTLKGEGFEIAIAHDLAASMRVLETQRPDVAIVDLGLGAESGLDLVRELQNYPQTGIIILSGKGDTIDRIVGLEVGADDYITKPFEPRELLARVRSYMRRSDRLGALRGSPSASSAIVLFDGWRLDRTGRELRSPSGDAVPLTTIEFDLLSTLAENDGKPVNRDDLFSVAPGHNTRSGYDRSVDVHIANLRKKIEQDPAKPQIIKTVRGVGYMLATTAQAG
ncbi:MAG: response regulator transcription factor [Alphaproteobacteria bacterium]|jgi:DNA-binding response OmpR family regulator|nr:response regulator transcription factor [Alphaproteobacteria bacterium]